MDTGYYTILTIVYVVAGLRYGPPRLWWLAVLTLIPVWLWTGPDWTYPIRLTIGLAVLTAALYGIRAWGRDRQRLTARPSRPGTSASATPCSKSGRASRANCTTSSRTTCR